MAAVARAGLGGRGRTLAAIQALQVIAGLVGQVVLLARWSPHAQTDLFLLLSAVPWLFGAAVLITGLDMALPAAYHRARAAGDDDDAWQLVAQVAGLSLLASAFAALGSGIVVAAWAARSGLPPGLSLWMGIALGVQVIPAGLGGLWRGALVAHDRLVRVRLVLLAGSLLTVAGYALLPGPPALALPLVTLGATALAAWLAGRFFRQDGRAPFAVFRTTARHPQIGPLARSLVALSVASGLLHLQVVIERAAVMVLGTGQVTALAVAGRGWDAVMAVIVAGYVLPAYPRWANCRAHGDTHTERALLRWSLRRTIVLSVLAAGGIGLGAWFWLAHGSHWDSGAQAARMALALLPRFVLVSSVQPLVLKHYATGAPWVPVIGAAVGVAVLGATAPLFIPRGGLAGIVLVTTISAIPGWLVLGWAERRRPR